MATYSFNTPQGMTLSQFFDLIDPLAQGAGITLDAGTFEESGDQFHFTQSPDLSAGQVNAIQDLLNNWVYVDYVAVAESAEQDFSNLPGWANWTIPQAETWHNDDIHNEVLDAIQTVNQLVIDAGNVVNFATALPVLQGMVAEMAHMVSIMQKLSVEGREEGVGLLSVRNKLWPHLQNGS